MFTRRMFHRVVSLLPLLSLLLMPVSPLVSQAAYLPAGQGLIPGDSALPLYRTTVTLRQPNDRARLDKLGVTVLQEGMGQAVILADEHQLEMLARLRFEPRGTDELGALVAAHAGAKPWLVAGLGLVLQAWEERGSAEFTDQALGQEDESGDSVNPLFSPELKAGLAALTSVDNDGDGLTDTQEAW